MTGMKTDGEEVELWFRATACFRREDSPWRITHLPCLRKRLRKAPLRGAVLLLQVLVIFMAAEAWTADQIQVKPDQITWGPMPSGLPPGAQSALLSGDPGSSGPFVIRVKAPAGYTVPPHHHSKDEDVTVIAGKVGFGMGETLSKDLGKAFPAGSFAHMPAGMVHCAWSEEDSIIQISGVGPFDIIYVNATDDPRNQAGSK
jgi:quercetin dioxygenase-like cupin family protein